MDWILSQLKRLGGHHRDHDEQMHLFYLLFVILLAVQAAMDLIQRGQRFAFDNTEDLSHAVMLGAHLLILAWLFRRRLLPPVAFALLLLAGWSLTRRLPDAPLHSYLAVYIALVVFLLRDDGAERSLALGSLRWICAIGWIGFGLQKLLHGFYFDGQYLAWQISTNRDSHLLLGNLVDARSLQQLDGFRGAAGTGPYSPYGTLLTVASNAVWALEILVGLGLIYWKSRPTALIVGFGLLLATALCYRDIYQSLLLFNLLLLFASPGYHRGGAALIIFSCVAILAGAMGFVPALAGAP